MLFRCAPAAFFRQGVDIEPTYRVITDGAWQDDSAYGVVHRIAADGAAKGVGAKYTKPRRPVELDRELHKIGGGVLPPPIF